MVALGLFLLFVGCFLTFMLGDVPACEECGSRLGVVKREHRGTAYADDSMNWATFCRPCKAEDVAYWQERWAEYYGMCR